MGGIPTNWKGQVINPTKIDQNNINYIDIDLIIKNEKNLMNLLEKRINE